MKDEQRLKNYVPNPGFQENFFKSKKVIRLATAGNQPLTLDTLVATPFGPRPLRDIKKGDFVFNLDGGKEKVNYIVRPGILPVYRITMNNGDSVETTENHCFLAYASQRRREVNDSQKLSVKELTKLKVPQILYANRIKYNQIVRMDPYLLGLFLGDGCSQQAGKGCHKDSFTNNSEILHEEFKSRVEAMGDKIIRYPSNPTQAYITKGYLGGRTSTNFSKKLKELGLYEKKAHNKFIPIEFIYGIEETRRQIVKGLVLTDGCVDKYRVHIFSNSKRMLEEVSQIYRSFGVRGKVNYRKPRGPNHRDQYYLSVSRDLLKKKGFEFGFKEKKEFTTSQRKHSCEIVKSIEYIGDKEVGCINISHPEHLFILANGMLTSNSGKTHMGCVEAFLYALGEHPHKKVRVPNIGVISAAAGYVDGIEKVIMPKILEIVGSKDIIKIKNNKQGVPSQIVVRSGSIIHLMSAEQDNIAFEGQTLHWFWLDEPHRRDIFIALKRGLLTTEGHGWMTCTPLEEPWMYQEIYIPGIEGSPRIDVFEGSSDENKRISQASKEEFLATLDEDEIETRWHGKFRHLAGRVIKSYQPDKHRVPSFDVPEHWPVWLSIDPHRNKPHAVLFFTMSPQGVAYICNEIFTKCAGDTLAEYIHDIESQYNMVDRLIDTSAQEDGWTTESFREILAKNKVRTRLAQKKNKFKSGITLINQAFKNDKMFVMEHCKRTHIELINWVYKKNKRDPQNPTEEPENKYDDMMANLRYILVTRPTYRRITEVQSQDLSGMYGRTK